MPIFKRSNNNTKKSSLLNSVQAQPPTNPELEALSASVNLEDIIENYDGVSRRSKSSVASYLNRQFSQSYFSANGNRDDDTTSFYTALSNVSPSSDTVGDKGEHTYGPGLLWDESEMTISRSTKSHPPMTHFQVYWEDLNYIIEPKISPSQIWRFLDKTFSPRISRIKQLLTPCNTFKEYNCTQPTKSSPKNSNEQLDKSEPITIIQNINGSFKSGELTAVMGPSGAGKTSLLNILSRRREEGYTGQLYVDGSHHRIKISTIPQHDSMPGYLTVRENLMFASRLKNTQKNYDQEKNIQRVSDLLGLDDCLDTMTKKISGGQQKRLAIAQELLSKPEILILDEPTSGLDSLTCYKTISVLKNLVRESARKLIDPIAIVVTIHQPQQEVFELFDKVYVMANGGVAIYNGPPDKCTQFVEQHSGVQMLDSDYDPASFMIEMASGEYGHEPIKKLEHQVETEFKLAKNKNMNKNSLDPEYTKAIKHQESQHINSISQYDLLDISTTQKQKSPLFIDGRIARGHSMNRGYFWSKTCTLTERCWLSMVRDPLQMVVRVSLHILLPVAFSLIFGQEPGRANACPKYKPEYQISELLSSDETTNNAPQDQIMLTLENSAIFFVLVYSIISANIGAVTLNFTLDIQRSLKEFYNGWYSMPSYIIARIMADLPMLVLMPAITIWLGYVLTGQAPGEAGIPNSLRISITVLAVVLGSMIGQSIGMIVGAIYIGHVSTALFVSQGAVLPMVFLSGFVTRTKSMSRFIYTLSYASIYRHVMDVSLLARYGFNVCECNSTQITGQPAKLLGVSDRLRSFTKYWMDSQTDIELPGGAENLKNSNQTSEDMFQLFAKQISLYNTYGAEINSCKDVQPFQLRDLSLNENHLIYSFVTLIILLVLAKALLFITVKFVVRLKTSL